MQVLSRGLGLCWRRAGKGRGLQPGGLAEVSLLPLAVSLGQVTASPTVPCSLAWRV